MSTNTLLIRALFGDPFDAHGSRRRRLLKQARHIRALRAWVKVGCYAWWRLTDDLKYIQREIRKELWP